ncbi:MAG: hypothetical protein KME45_32820 [Stenomitos rutilans HA7619-LM2]|jgi:hypothetical protein|nr:hypothetical protein [Stenomitos rutilans HA7619-LM2]
MNRQFPDFRDTLEWNLVARATYQASQNVNVNDRLPSRTYLIEHSHVLIIGVSSQSARSTWRTGGWAAQILPFSPSTTSQFVAAVQSSRRWLRLHSPTLVVFPKVLPTYFLELSFPYWFNDVSVEIWRYDGRDFDTFERLDQLEANLNHF